MTYADPQTPPNEDGLPEEETRESGGENERTAEVELRTSSEAQPPVPRIAADRLLPPFLLVQRWKPTVNERKALDWWTEAYLFECGHIHADERLAHHAHGRILGLVVLDRTDDVQDFLQTLKEAQDEEDWVEECRLIASS